MRRFLLLILLGLFAIPGSTWANNVITVLNPLSNNALTVNLATAYTSGYSPMLNQRNLFTTVSVQPEARMGFYVGRAQTPPPSMVGWDFHPHLLAQVRYGLFLTQQF